MSDIFRVNITFACINPTRTPLSDNSIEENALGNSSQADFDPKG